MHEQYSAVIAAGGASSRFGSDKLKLKLGGKHVISHAVDLFDNDEECDEVIVCAGAAVKEMLESNPLIFSSPKLRVVDGGASRAQSVAKGVDAAKCAIIAVHDAARPNASADLLARLKRAVQPGSCAAPALAVSDSLVQTSLNGTTRSLAQGADSYLAREGLAALQTPQLFYKADYEAAAAGSADLSAAGDESALFAQAGLAVALIDGEAGNVKLTSAADQALLLKLMGQGHTGKGKDRYGGLGW